MIEHVESSLVEVEGKVTVELFDDLTGRLYRREKADNFASVFLQDTLKQYQRNLFGMYFAGTRTTDSYGRYLWALPPFPLSHLAAWNDSSAEDSANERAIKGDLPVAFASRFPQGSPTGKRGVINISESTASPSSQTYVFDWAGGNGNGTFQSVGWCNCTSSGYPVSLWMDPYAPAPLTVNITAPTTYYRGGLWHDGTGWVTLHTTGQTVGSAYAIYRIDETTGNGTSLCTLPASAFRYATNTNPPNATDLCMIGTDYYVVGSLVDNSPGNPTHLAKFNSAGTQQWLVVHDGGTNEMPSGQTGNGLCITTDGTDLYVGHAYWSGSGGKIYKLSASTGLVTATINLPSFIPAASSGVAGLAWDGTNLRVNSYSGLCNVVIDTSGNLVTPMPSPLPLYYGGGDSGTATSPFSGPYYGTTSHVNQLGYQQYGDTSSSTAMDDMKQIGAMGLPSYGGTLSPPGTSLAIGGCHMKSGKMYSIVSSGGITTPTRIVEVVGTNLGTRSLLGAPVTKDSSKTMKITYTFNFS